MIHAFGGLSPMELVICLVIVLLIFGAGKIPKIGKALGEGIGNFKRATRDDDRLEEIEPKATDA